MELKAGYKQTEVGVIPRDWDVKPLISLSTEIGDGIHATPNYVRVSEFFFVNGNNLVNDSIAVTVNTMCVSETEHKALRQNLTDRTVLLSINGTIGNLAFYEGEKVVLGKSAAYINISREVSRKFIAYRLKSWSTELYFENELTGTTIRNLSLQSLRNTPIPVPPTLAEQRAIAAALSDVDALIASLDKLIAKKRDIKQASMQQLLSGRTRLPGFGKGKGYKQTEVGLIPEDWDLQPLERITDPGRPISYGIVQTGRPVEDGVKCVRVLDIENGRINPENLITTSEEISSSYKRTLLKKGDLAIALRGKIGELAVIEDNLVGANLTRGLALIAPLTGHDSQLLYQYLSSAANKQLLEKNLNGSALKEIPIGTLRKIPAVLPTLPEQRAIAKVLSDMDSEINALEARRDKTELLKQGMMQELLTGRIRLL